MKPDISQYIKIHGKDLGRLCSSLCQNHFDAEDLYQATWEKVIRNYKKYDESRPFDKWLWSICINAYKDMLKNPFRRRVVSFDSSEDLERILLSVPTTEQDRDDCIVLHKAISRLEPQKRQVIALYYFKDLSTAELSQILNIPEGTVKSRLSSARAQIRKELNNE